MINACEVASVDYINDHRLHTVQSWLANETVQTRYSWYQNNPSASHVFIILPFFFF
jgi:hypothetical protein